MSRILVAVAGWAVVASGAMIQAADWQRLAIDSEFRAEGVAAADFNKDGKTDIAVGDYWYAAPDWKQHKIRQPLAQSGQPTDKYDGSTGYSNNFAMWAWDVDQDGWQDLIVIGYPGDPFYWYENPKGAEGPWKAHVIWHSACNETPLFTDLTGDGRPELILGSQPERQMGFVELPTPEKCRDKWVFTPISEAGEPNENGTFKYYHGLGVGDMNLDGRTDVIIPHGWWEAPEDRKAGLWEFHPQPLAQTADGKPLQASNIFVIDLDLDGDQDVFMGNPHAFGVWWFENPGKDSKEPFRYHLIDDSFSQTHAMDLVKLAGSDNPTVVTGKRYFAHGGRDPGGKDPVIMVTYEIVRAKGEPPKFVRQEITAGKDTGVGTQFQMVDFDGDGALDVVLSNKKGVNVLLQKPAK